MPARTRSVTHPLAAYWRKTLAAYWRKTLGLFRDRQVKVVLSDGRERTGVLRASGDSEPMLWTDDGPAKVPLELVVSVEAL